MAWDWVAIIGNLVNRIPIERVLFPPRDKAKELQTFADSLNKEFAPSPAIQTAEKTPKSEPQATSGAHLPHPQPGGVSLEETIDYQKREVGKLLLRMERHYSQRLRINGIPCECGAGKHLLDLESLSEETIPMVDNPQVYYSVLEWIKKVGPKSTDEAAKSGVYDKEYPTFSHEARDFRKEIIGSLDPNDLFPQKPGEPAATRILPEISEDEKAEIKRRAIQKIDQVLG